MATGRQTIEWTAKATGIPVPTVAHAAKMAGPFFTRGGQGGGPNARQSRVGEIINLVIAASWSPISEAQATIQHFRAMVPAQRGMPFLCEANETGYAPMAIANDSVHSCPDIPWAKRLMHM